MRLGTRSVLFGAHQFLIHPVIVAICWWRLYGFPRDLRLWVAFVVHDLGYIGKGEMDSPEGEEHPFLGARIMSTLFDREKPHFYNIGKRPGGRRERIYHLGAWGEFVLFHSRFLAKRCQEPYSQLCVADKLAIALTPAWLYLPLVRATGEVHEYMATYHTRTISGQDKTEHFTPGDERAWFGRLQDYMLNWVEEHRDLKPDTWTNRAATGGR